MHTSLMPHGLYTYDMCVCRTLSHSSSAIYSSGLSWGSTCVTGFGTSLCSALNGCIKPQAAPTRTLLSLSVVLGFIHFPFCVCVCHAPSQHGFSLLLLSQRLVLRIGNTGPDTTNGPASGWSVCLLSYHGTCTSVGAAVVVVVHAPRSGAAVVVRALTDQTFL